MKFFYMFSKCFTAPNTKNIQSITSIKLSVQTFTISKESMSTTFFYYNIRVYSSGVCVVKNGSVRLWSFDIFSFIHCRVWTYVELNFRHWKMGFLLGKWFSACKSGKTKRWISSRIRFWKKQLFERGAKVWHYLEQIF